ncbi:MAG: TIGR04255 family protein [Chitinophagaceae bacterium]|nr:TIGR04255 family protein [Chitinophagaceae bacterium]
MTKLPIKISPCPIIEAIVELKFKSAMPKGAIFGILYNAVKDKFNKVDKLPASMLPNEIIENDPDLKYKALYRLTNSNSKFIAQVGMDIVSFQVPNNYIGWKDFLENATSFFKTVNEIGLIEQPISLTLRYLNFFELDIFKHINIQVQMIKEPYHSNNLIIRTEVPQGEFVKVLQVANNVTISNALDKKQGSLLDIACVLSNSDKLLLSNIEKLLNDAHKIEKELFFNLLKDEFLKTLNPEYQS